MSIRMIKTALPAAALAIGLAAMTASPSFATDNARDDYANQATPYTAGFSLTGQTHYKKKRQHITRQSKDRFSGFGFRGDGFKFSGQYQ